MRILLKYPSRGRKDLFFDTLQAWVHLLSGEHNVQMLCSFDHTDKQMTDPEVVARLSDFAHDRADRCKINWRFGANRSKIEACNADMADADEWDMMILVSDDMLPQVEGYEDVIARDLVEHFPKFGGCIRYADGLRSDLCTLSIMGKPYYDAVGFVYHPKFFSLFADDFHQFVAESTGRMVYIPDKIPVRHLWQAVTGNDDLHKVNSPASVFRRDEATFRELKRSGIPKEIIDRINQLER
jgi:hypothetical protein